MKFDFSLLKKTIYNRVVRLNLTPSKPSHATVVVIVNDKYFTNITNFKKHSNKSSISWTKYMLSVLMN